MGGFGVHVPRFRCSPSRVFGVHDGAVSAFAITRSLHVGAGAMSAAGSQLALMLIDDRDKTPSTTTASSTTTPPSQPAKPANAGELPPGALESAFERAKARLALANTPAQEIDQ